VSLFEVHGDLVEARTRLRNQVDLVLAKLATGQPPSEIEREQIDLKEEPGRRGPGGSVLPGERRSHAAVELLAREVPCMANTPGGGVLILGVEDRGGRLLGTELDTDWLRHRTFERVEIAPAIEERHVDGVRLLVIYVAEAREPVEDPDRRLRWRVDDHCVPVDRSEWWLRRQERAGLDVMAATTERTVDDVADGAMLVARRFLAASDQSVDEELRYPRDLPAHELLRRLGVLRPDGALTQAGVLVFCPAPRTLIALSRLDVPGGDVLNAPPDFAGLALLEQLAAVEDRVDAFNAAHTVRRGLAETPIRGLPPRAVREAILNGLVHRDWMQPDEITVTWFEYDSALEVTSPGGFVGGVTADNVLTQRYARYPALSDLFRALRLVEKQGIGVDRMFREMIALGHRPPTIVEQPGPRVRTRLVGGDPVVPVMTLVGAIAPEHRRRDVRVAIIVHRLLHDPFLTVSGAAAALQSSTADAADALDPATGASVPGGALLAAYKDVWLLSRPALAEMERAGEPLPALHRRGLITYRRPSPEAAVAVVRHWLASHDRITSGDYAVLTGLTQAGALKALDRLTREGLLERGNAQGRSAHYRMPGAS
jgi:ATP-dependent DNA helicase RecG